VSLLDAVKNPDNKGGTILQQCFIFCG